MSGIRGYVAAHAPRFVAELRSLVRFPSVSADPSRRDAVRACAEWLARHLAGIGLERARVAETGGHPLVAAEWRRAGERPTLLVYGHYDVQPVDPLESWRVPPFEAAVERGVLHGRGASDDKGQLFTHLKAIEAWLATEGALPVNLVCLFDGEEEIGSPHLAPALEREGLARGADVAVVSDTRMQAPGRPALTYAIRGELKCELVVSGPSHDLHAGHYGGAVHDPLEALAELVAGLHDRKGRVSVPGFYDRVRPVGAAERARLARDAPDDAEVARLAGAGRGWGEPGYSLFERTTIRPALIVNGIAGGYAGPGHKAVLPSLARAKLSARLVPDQDPDEVEQALRHHLARHTPPTVRVRYLRHAGARPVRFDPSHPAMRAAVQAYRAAFGRPPVLLPSGGTIPIVSLLQERFGIPTVLMGFALPDDQPHAPNEKFELEQLFRGIVTSAEFMGALGRSGGGTHGRGGAGPAAAARARAEPRTTPRPRAPVSL